MKRLLVILVVLSLFTVSCGKKEVKKETEDSRIAAAALLVVEKIKNSYAKMDMAAVEANMTKDGFTAFRTAIKGFDSAEIEFSPLLMEIDDQKVSLNIAWKGKWQRGGSSIEERGMAVFILKGSPLKVDSILRANPFSHPE
ncbi:MAG: hypothetical protein L0Y62_05350 [Nitrospirae bacterium]|nr:hypothetical protein [Nitrospirota bacterium]